MIRKKVVVTAAIAGTALLGLPAQANAGGCVANQYIQVWSCAINVPGGACYRWYAYQTNPPYKSYCPSVTVGNKYVYNRYQF